MFVFQPDITGNSVTKTPLRVYVFVYVCVSLLLKIPCDLFDSFLFPTNSSRSDTVIGDPFF